MTRQFQKLALLASAAMIPGVPALAQDSDALIVDRTAGAAPLALLQASSARDLEEQPEQVPERREEGGLTTIVVTAQKREDSLQSTPLAISAITTDEIVAQGIADVADLSAIAPNLSSAKTTAATTNVAIFIRGIGEADPGLTLDSPVALYVDGIIVGRSAGSAFDIVDLERIEVLRGPQGTLYGRNTTGGAVNLITKQPSNEFGVEAFGSYGNFNFFQGRVSIDTGTLGETGLRAKVSYLHKQRDGYFDDLNSPSSEDPGAYNTDAVRATLAFNRNEGFKADYTFSYNDTESYAIPFQLASVRPDIAATLALSPALGGSEPIISLDRVDAIRLNDGLITDEVTGHTLAMELELNENLVLRSLSGYRTWDNTASNGDLDGNDNLRVFTVSPAILAPPNPFIPTGVQEVSLFTTDNERSQEQFSQEFNVLGEYDRFNFVLGGYFFTEEADEDNPQFFTIFIPSPVPIPLGPGLSASTLAVPTSTRLIYQHENESLAFFGQGTYNFTDALRLTVGARYTMDDKSLVQESPIVRELDRSFEELTYAATIDYDISPDVLVYARYATGYKAGGFNARSVNDGFDPETIASYEAGMKGEFLNNTLRLNLALFYSDYTDVQIQQFLAGSGGATSITVNAGSATYQGIEAELIAIPVTGLTLSGSIGYVDRDYQTFLFRDPATNQVIDIAEDASFRYSPPLTGQAAIAYEFEPFDFGTFSLRADYSYVGARGYDPLDFRNPRAQLIQDDAYHTVDLRATLGDIQIGNGEALVALWGRNVLDEEYQNSAIDFGGLGFAGISYAEGATYGIDLRFRY